MKPFFLFLSVFFFLSHHAIASVAILAPLAAVLKLDGIAPHHDGPNCWNLSLVAAGTLPALRHTTAQEFSFYLDSPYCRRVADADVISGDIGVYRGLKFGSVAEIHAFVHVSPELVFSKNGTGNDSKYLLQPREEMERIYGEPNRQLTHYRCGSAEALWRSPKIPSELRGAIDQLSAFEQGLQQFVLFGSTLSFDSRSNLLSQIERISRAPLLSPESRMLADILKLRLAGIEEQLHLAGEHFLAVEVGDRRRRLGSTGINHWLFPE